jgi:hypothetical protein
VGARHADAELRPRRLFSRGGGGSLLVAAGLSYFVVNNLGFGLSLRNFTTFLPASLKADFPGIEKQIPTNEFSVIPGVTVVLYRSFRFSPYIAGGVGPVFLNHKRGVVGEWNAGPGVLIGLGRMLALSLGVSFSMRFPGDRATPPTATPATPRQCSSSACGLRWGINGGLVFGFGVGRKRNPPPPPEDPTYAPAPEPEPYPEPAPSPGYTVPGPAPAPSRRLPARRPQPPSHRGHPRSPAAEPPAPAPTAPPPGESVPVAPAARD